MVLVVGIPTRNEFATIDGVVSAVDMGLSLVAPGVPAYIINADNSADEQTAHAFLSTPTNATKVSIRNSNVGTGKGTNVFSIMERATALHADALCLIDGDLRSARPEWLEKLFAAALTRKAPTFVTPEYERGRYEANSTNQLVVPYLRAAFGLDVRQPIGGEFAMNSGLLRKALKWQRAESTNLYGIDVWLTVNTALHGHNLDSVYIGRKVHSPTFPKIFELGEQVVDALFRLMLQHRPARPNLISRPTDEDLRVYAESSKLPAEIVNPIKEKAATYIFDNWDELVFTFPGLLNVTKPAKGTTPFISSNLWCEILSEAYAQLTVHSFRRVRDHLVGLFPARVLSYWDEIESLSPPEIDAFLENQALHVAELFASRMMPSAPVDLRKSPELLTAGWNQRDVEHA